MSSLIESAVTPNPAAVMPRACPACAEASRIGVAELFEDGAFAECGKCGLQFLDPVPSRFPVFQDFTDYGRDLMTRLSDGAVIDDELVAGERVVLDLVRRGVTSGAAVLELCCESGRFLAALRSHGYAAYGVDPVQRSIDMLRANGFLVATGLVDAVSADWPEPRAVVMLESLVRFPEPVALFREIRRRFPRAVVYATVRSPRHSLKLSENDRRHAYPPHHLVRWSSRSLTAAFRSAGYAARIRSLKVGINWPVGRGRFGNAVALGLRLVGEGEFALLAKATPA